MASGYTLGLPFQGSTPGSAHASYTGAVVASESRQHKTAIYRAFVQRRGSVTDEEAEILLGFRRSSVCSIRNSLVDAGEIRQDGVRTITRDINGRIRRITHATWRLTTPAERELILAQQQQIHEVAGCR